MRIKLGITIEQAIYDHSKKFAPSGNFSQLVEDALVSYLQIPTQAAMLKAVEEIDSLQSAISDAERIYSQFSTETLHQLSACYLERHNHIRSGLSRFSHSWFDFENDEVRDACSDLDLECQNENYLNYFFTNIVERHNGTYPMKKNTVESNEAIEATIRGGAFLVPAYAVGAPSVVGISSGLTGVGCGVACGLATVAFAPLAAGALGFGIYKWLK